MFRRNHGDEVLAVEVKGIATGGRCRLVLIERGAREGDGSEPRCAEE